MPFVVLEAVTFGPTKKTRPRVPQGRPASVQGSPPPGVPKNRSQKQKRATAGTSQATAPTWESKFESVASVGYIVRCSFASCFDDGFLMDCSIILVQTLAFVL